MEASDGIVVEPGIGEYLAVRTPQRVHATRALRRASLRFYRIDEDGSVLEGEDGGVYTPNYVSPVAQALVGPQVYIDCKSEVTPERSEANGRIVAEELHREGVTQAWVVDSGSWEPGSDDLGTEIAFAPLSGKRLLEVLHLILPADSVLSLPHVYDQELRAFAAQHGREDSEEESTYLLPVTADVLEGLASLRAERRPDPPGGADVRPRHSDHTGFSVACGDQMLVALRGENSWYDASLSDDARTVLEATTRERS
jgi:hypothetical protein